MSVEQHIFRERAGHFRPDCCRNLIAFTLRTLLPLAGLGRGYLSLVELDRPVMADFDEDLPAIFLGALDIFPAVEIRPALKADDIAPAVFLVGLDPLGNRGGLCLRGRQ